MSLIKTKLVLCMLAFAGAGHAQVFTYKDWAVACDNTRHCEAVAYQSDEADAEPVVLWLSRDAGPGAPVSMQVDVGDSDDQTQLTLRLGNSTLKGVAPQKDLSAEQTGKLLAYFLVGQKVNLSSGSKRWELSLAGSNAALLKMDEVQGRIGTPGAFIRKGNKPESAAFLPLQAPKVKAAALPKTTKADEALLPLILRSITPRDCWDDLPDDSGPETSITRVSTAQVVVIRECSRGAYQGGSGLWLANSKPPYAAKRLEVPIPGGEATDYVMNASFTNGVLASYEKGRGVFDCGAGYQWVWTGKAFALTHAWSAPLCRGMPAGGYDLRTFTADAAP